MVLCLASLAALFTITKLWKWPKCPSTDAWIKKCGVYICDGILLGIKKNEILPFAMTRIELDSIRLSKVSQ